MVKKLMMMPVETTSRNRGRERYKGGQWRE
jgi:hypothetical protein